MSLRPVSAVPRMLPIRGHTARGLKQDVTLRVYAPADGDTAAWGCIDINGESFRFASRAEALGLLDEYLRVALQRAAQLSDPA